MKKEYTDSTASTPSGVNTSDDVTVSYQVVVPDIVTSTVGPKREATSDRDRDSNSNSDSDNAPPSHDDCDGECYYGTLKKKPSQSQQQQELQQFQEHHPCMSLSTVELQ